MKIELNPGEIYVGHYGTTPNETIHVILLPGDNDDASWQHQKEWAASIGAELPTRLEQALLWQNCREEHKKDWYWSSEAHVSDAGYAWCQDFYDGYQYSHYHGDRLRARAVRRVVVVAGRTE